MIRIAEEPRIRGAEEPMRRGAEETASITTPLDPNSLYNNPT